MARSSRGKAFQTILDSRRGFALDGDMPEHPKSPWPALPPVLFVVSLVAYAAGLPLGVDRLGAGAPVAAVLDATGQERVAPLGLLAGRVAAFLPLGDLPTRINLATAVLAALALALLGWVCMDVLLTLRPLPHARQEAQHFMHEPVLVAGAVLAGGMALATFHGATSAGAASATLALLAGAWLVALPLLRGEGGAGRGLILAGLAGLAAGVDAVAAPLLWPLLLGLCVWELRRGSRWPLLAPVVFVAALGGSLLASLAATRSPMGALHLLVGTWPDGMQGRTNLLQTAAELCDQLGVVSSLLAGMGLLVLLKRAPLVALWFVFTLVTALLLGDPLAHGGLGPESARAGMPTALLATAIPLCAGMAELAGRLGRARFMTAVVLTALAVVSPALDGGTSRWQRDTRGNERLLEHAFLRAPLRASVDPGTPEMEGLLLYGLGLGMRPDLEIKARGR